MNLVNVSLEYLNSLCGDQAYVYNLLDKGRRNLYLPSPKAQCMSNNYLEGVFYKKYFSLKKEFLKVDDIVRKSTCDELVIEIEKDWRNSVNMSLGLQV